MISKTSKHKTVPKGWGFEKWIVNKSEYCGKLLYFVKGHKCSLHYHKIKDEVFYLQSGKLKIRHGCFLGDDSGICLSEEILEKGDSFYVPVGLIHQMEALEDSELFEFSTQHFDEDSYRIEKGD